MFRVLVPTDFSEAAQRALQFAIDTLPTTASQLVIAHVRPEFPVSTGGRDVVAAMSAQQDSISAALADFAHPARSRVPNIVLVQAVGEPVQAIVSLAAQFDVATIVFACSRGGPSSSRLVHLVATLSRARTVNLAS